MRTAKTYTAPHDVYVGLLFVPAGEEFTTDAKAGKEWAVVPEPKAEKPAKE